MGARWKRTNVRAERGNHGVREFDGFINLFRPCLARFRELDLHGLQGLLRSKGLPKLRTRRAPLFGNRNRLVLALSTRLTASDIARRLYPQPERQNCNPLVSSLAVDALTLELTLLVTQNAQVRVIR